MPSKREELARDIEKDGHKLHKLEAEAVSLERYISDEESKLAEARKKLASDQEKIREVENDILSRTSRIKSRDSE